MKSYDPYIRIFTFTYFSHTRLRIRAIRAWYGFFPPSFPHCKYMTQSCDTRSSFYQSNWSVWIWSSTFPIFDIFRSRFEILNFFCSNLQPNCLLGKLNSRIVGTHFSNQATRNNREMIAERRSVIFSRRSRWSSSWWLRYDSFLMPGQIKICKRNIFIWLRISYLYYFFFIKGHQR